jgi:hypothetical protein
MVQSVGPEFKPQYSKKKKESLKIFRDISYLSELKKFINRISNPQMKV